MDSATADTVSAQPELQLLLCLAAIAKALNGELQPRTFPAAVWRTEAKRQSKRGLGPVITLIHSTVLFTPPAGRHAGLPWRIVQMVKPTAMRSDTS
jgi:hypothetical protein